MLKMVDGTGIIGVDMVCPLGISTPQPPNYDKIEMEGVGSLMLPNGLKAPLERVELLGNSVQGENPAPDNPQEIKSAGRKSKNLLNLQKQPDVKETYLGWKVSDGRNVVLSVNDKGNNADITGCYLGLSRTGGSSDGVVWVVNNGSVAVKEVVSKNQYVSVFPSNETTVRKLLERFDIQVEYGSNATDYEPYGYFFDLKITGKNLLSNKPTNWMIGKTTSWGAVPQTPVSYGKNVKNAIATINVKSSTNYSFINKETNKLWVCRIIELDANGLGLVNHALYANESFNYKKYNFSTRSNTANIVFEIKKVDNTELLSTDIESNKIMLVEGEVNELTPYEPYTEQFMQIVLNEPLRGIGEYKDVLTKDGVVRKIKRTVFDGSEDEKWALSNDPKNITTNRFCIGMKTINTYYKMLTMCNKMAWKNANQVDVVGQSTHGVNFYITLPKDLAPDLQTFRTWLSQNSLTVDYVLAEPVTELLPESVQDQLSALHSENGVTHVFVDSGEVECGIKLTYRKEK